MSWSTFDIRYRATNKSVDFNELDNLICAHFGLKNLNPTGNADYGHFPFEKNEISQSSISWVGLIHTIIKYSDIDYGKRRKSEVLGALAFMIEHYVKFPLRMIHVLSQLLDFLYDKQDLFIYVTIMSDEYDRTLYRNIYKHKMILENETGLFLCDEDGKLLSYYPSVNVLIDKTKVREYYTYGDAFYKPCIYSMLVPHGVSSFTREFFRGGYIAGNLELPNTIKTIGSEFDSGVFAETCIGRIILPNSIESIGTFALGNSKIAEFVYPDKIIELQYARQFKGTMINKLLLPQRVYDYLQVQGRSIESLFNPFDINISDYILY